MRYALPGAAAILSEKEQTRFASEILDSQNALIVRDHEMSKKLIYNLQLSKA